MKKAKTGGVIRVEIALAERLDALHLALLQDGLRVGYRGVSTQTVLYYAVMRWLKVSSVDVNELVKCGQRAKEGFIKSRSAASQAAPAASIAKRPLRIPVHKEFDARISQLASQFMQHGVPNGRFAVNRNAIMRQALRRWKDLAHGEAEDFSAAIAKLWK